MNEQYRLTLLLKQLKSVPCPDCVAAGRDGIWPPECMDFDHRPGTVKVGSVSWLTRCGEKVFLEEVAKCDVICACCHRIRSKQRGFTPEQIAKLSASGKIATTKLWKNPEHRSKVGRRKRTERRLRMAKSLWDSLIKIGALNVFTT